MPAGIAALNLQRMNTLGNWTDLLTAAAVFLFVAALIVALAIGLLRLGMWALDRWIGERRFQALTLLLAVTGGIAALYQSRMSAVEAWNEKARVLALAEDCVSGLVFLTSFDGSTPLNTRAIPGAKLRKDMPLLLSYTKTLNDLDLKTLPSAFSMTTIVKARAQATALIEKAAKPERNVDVIDLDAEQADLMVSLRALNGEEARLFPLYKIGPTLVGQPVRFR